MKKLLDLQKCLVVEYILNLDIFGYRHFKFLFQKVKRKEKRKVKQAKKNKIIKMFRMSDTPYILSSDITERIQTIIF